MHYGLIAVKGEVGALMATFSEVWPNYELAAEATFNSIDEVWRWMKANEKYVASTNWSMENQAIEVYALRQDGDWTVLLDPTYMLASDEPALRALSEKFGHCLSFVA